MSKEFALITGASKGLGKAFALEISKRNIDTILVGLPNEGLSELTTNLKRDYNVNSVYHETDLTIKDIDAYHNDTGYSALLNLSNEVDVTVENLDADNDAGASHVSLYANDVLVDKLPVSGLVAGSNETVQFIWTPSGCDCEDGCSPEDFTLRAVADCDDEVIESDETNNESTVTETAYWAGYSADEDLIGMFHGTIQGGIYYTTGDGGYGCIYSPGANTLVTNYDMAIPSGATIEQARLNIYYTWSKEGSTGVYPLMEVSITNSTGTYTVPSDAEYNDRPCASPAIGFNYPFGNYVYDVTDYAKGESTVTVTIENVGLVPGHSFCIAAPAIAILYEDSTKPEYEYWLIEGADLLEGGRRGGAGNLDLSECIAEAVFEGTVDVSSVQNAALGIVSAWGGAAWGQYTSFYWMNDCYLGNGSILGGYGSLYEETVDSISMYVGESTDAQIGVNVCDVDSYLVNQDNTLKFGDDGDSMLAANAFLMLESEGGPQENSDLITTEVNINPGCGNVVDEIFVNEPNEICAVIENIGADNAGAFDVCFTADGVNIGCTGVSGLAAGANTTVCIDWTPDCSAYTPPSRGEGAPAIIVVTADCECSQCPNCPDGSCGVIDEDDESNNALTVDTAVYENGYKSKEYACSEETLGMHTYEDMYGDVVYNVSGEKNYPFEVSETDTRLHTITVPTGMNVLEARLYVYGYDYFYNPSPGYLPELKVTVAGTEYSAPGASYDDQKGFGTYNTPKWMYAYDVTSQVTGSGDYTVVVENTGSYNTTLLGEMLVVICEDPASGPANKMNIWMLEGCDYLKGDENYCVAVDESTSTATFTGLINTPSLVSAELITVVAQGMAPGSNKLVNGAVVDTDVWDADSEAYPLSKINVDVEDVTTLLVSNDNTIGFQDTGTNGMQACNAILVAREGEIANRVYFDPVDSGADHGESTVVAVYADTTDMIQGGQINLTYTSDCANVTEVAFDSMWDLSATWDSNTGREWLTFARSAMSGPVNGVAHICDLTIECGCDVYCETPLHFVSQSESANQYCMLSNDVGAEVTGVVWHDGTFTCTNLPDLVITELYGLSTSGDNYEVTYTVTNEGNAAASAGHTTTLYIDDVETEQMSVPDALAPGASYTGTFSELALTLPNDKMEVCADSNNDVLESDETNNCMISYYPAGIEIAVDVLDDGECVDFQEQFIVNITVDPRNIPVYGVQYKLSFDKSVLHAEWQNEGSFLSSDGAGTMVLINNIDNGNGIISFAATRIETEDGVTDPGTLAVIKFTAMKQGANSSLTLSEVKASNDDGGIILPLDLINDEVCVSQNDLPVAVATHLYKYNNDGQKYISKVYFNGSGSYDPDGEIANWRWYFGDGNYGTGEMKDHVYQTWNWNGTGYDPFIATLTVTDDGDPHQLDDTVFFEVVVYIAGDANGDGWVDILDGTIVGMEWDNTYGTPQWIDRTDQADLNNDGTVDILDAVIIGTCWEHTAWEGE